MSFHFYFFKDSSFELTAASQFSSARALALSEMSGEHPNNDIIDPNFG
jgi:hypothetical protein